MTAKNQILERMNSKHLDGRPIVVLEKGVVITRSLRASCQAYGSDSLEGVSGLIDKVGAHAVLVEIQNENDPGIDALIYLKDLHSSIRTLAVIPGVGHSEDLELRAFKAGADDVIFWPLSDQLLQLKLDQVVGGEVPETLHNGFLKQVDQVIEERLQGGSFQVRELADNLGINRKTFYLRIVEASGMPPQDYIRKRRLEHAARFLATGEFSISEVAAKVGYKDLSNFTRSFREEFGICPSEYY